METLKHKKILLGITGGIAAYKSADLCRQLKTAGADVQVVLTTAAAEFITPLTMQALSGNPVHQHLLNPEAEAGMGHIELAKWADRVIIAPASADIIARLAAGMANDLLTTLCLATEAPIALAPAMNQAMWRDPRTQDNCARLESLGMTIWGPGVGDQACGDSGPGRMLEATELAQLIAATFDKGRLCGKKITITAGPTREAIDPVRYISNHSSGKMGYALAQAAVDAGAEVTLVSGPVNLPAPRGVDLRRCDSADAMLAACLAGVNECDIFIAAAAVADYRVADVANQKIKKSADKLTLELIRNPDILATVAAHPQRPFCVGFAAETEQVTKHARDKLQRKGLNLIIANDVSQPDIGFNSDDNAVTLIDQQGDLALGPAPKQQLARQLIDAIAQRYENNAS
ncbi:bifunctional phosphopantothenoylcysteine decarboxylase/phosphopantothenate--cysteine ligase CoaBC [Motiliproteus sediminis]|uniref:bifunctional phosphopantothenoylcysteine decarboxylase/phosphopantothenate--cysteine ligase CoaBC n=1 Tax=Motiliproteus sediminis TaxID=1468178 RepID=UPI001AEFDB6B|nr:bifunctional phosphopantothenoylcysteine decarboxylase/phosphopantothenate--cysteine ligase CoaBC [Motiliproteus sediminis]